MLNMEEEIGRTATGSESLREFAHNAGMDNPDRPWLLDSRDVWVANPYYNGPPARHPEDNYFPWEDSSPCFEEVQPQPDDGGEDELLPF